VEKRRALDQQRPLPPAITAKLYKDLRGWRATYIRALEQAHHGQYNPLVNVIGRAVEDGLGLFLEAFDALPQELRRPLRDVAAVCS
jgi:hypothetical protein